MPARSLEQQIAELTANYEALRKLFHETVKPDRTMRLLAEAERKVAEAERRTSVRGLSIKSSAKIR
jgi:hypothetical protein